MLTGDYSSCCRKHIAPCSCSRCREVKRAKYSRLLRQQLQGILVRENSSVNPADVFDAVPAPVASLKLSKN